MTAVREVDFTVVVVPMALAVAGDMLSSTAQGIIMALYSVQHGILSSLPPCVVKEVSNTYVLPQDCSKIGVCLGDSDVRRKTAQSPGCQEDETCILAYSLAYKLHPLEKFCEFVDCGLMGRSIDTGVPKGSQALDEAPDLHAINATTFECRIERREARGLGRNGDPILRRNFRQVDL